MDSPLPSVSFWELGIWLPKPSSRVPNASPAPGIRWDALGPGNWPKTTIQIKKKKTVLRNKQLVEIAMYQTFLFGSVGDPWHFDAVPDPGSQDPYFWIKKIRIRL
jgi:hypothetical protein